MRKNACAYAFGVHLRLRQLRDCGDIRKGALPNTTAIFRGNFQGRSGSQ
ncbi:hypothetical protein HW132_20915 [Brasilonema sp. CT11]|nr:hypothetical protein [Brasilonema sp. CT11]